MTRKFPMRAALVSGAAVAALMVHAPALAQQEDLPPPKVQTITAWNMSPRTGTLQMSNTDLSIGGLSLERFNQEYPGKNKFHNQNNPEHAPFGFRTSNNFDIYVMPSFQPATDLFVGWDGQNHRLNARYNVTVHLGSSSAGLYQQQGSTTNPTFAFMNGDAFSGMMGLVGGAYVYIDSDGDIYTFNPSVNSGGTIGGSSFSQRVDNIQFANGRVQQFYYDTSKNLKLVTDSSGYAILFDIGTNGYVAAACAIDMARTYVTAASTCTGQALTVTYQYDSTPQLTGFTDVLGGVTTYGYGGVENAGDLTCIKPPTYSSCQASLAASMTTDGLDETLADGSVWHIVPPEEASWSNYDWDFPNWTGDGGAWVYDPAGKLTLFGFSNSSPLTITDPDNRVTTYKWVGGASVEPSGTMPSQDGTMLAEVDYPEGNKYLATYSAANFNAILQATEKAKPGSGLADRVVNYTYGTWGASGVTAQNLAKPLSRTDPKGNTTNWTYASWGGVLSEMQPAPASGAARPLKLYTYVQKSAYVLNSVGSLVSTGQPVWLPATETECQTVAGSTPSPVCDATAPQMVTTFEYSANGTADNLLLRGKIVSDGTTSLRTCYGYDAYSRKISETSPRAGLTGC